MAALAVVHCSWDEMTHWARFTAQIKDLWHGDKGASLVEYSLLVALIALVAVVAIRFFGGELSTAYSDIAQSFP